jgi:hypothetical protein
MRWIEFRTVQATGSLWLQIGLLQTVSNGIGEHLLSTAALSVRQ